MTRNSTSALDPTPLEDRLDWTAKVKRMLKVYKL